ncbi:MAG: hypothetical protein LBH62_03945 [Nitrososphaerota archaeon]|jgi:transcription initiation factor TFIIIB Brf1 subunit/transcription initiation factor TFIIB|nr:hypothetical protein [Nitrososphaerota archaeon]
MCENEKCPECKSTNILDDNENGEAVCMNCGLVIGKTEFTPPQDRTSTTNKNASKHPIIYTSSAIGTKTPSNKRTELKIAIDIHHLIPKLGLPQNMEETAIHYMRKLRHETKKHNPQKIRFTKNELITISIWTTIKQQEHPLSSDEYIKKLEDYIKIKNLMKIEKRASYFIKNKNRTPTIPLITAHIIKIADQLENNKHLERTYASKLCSYAIQILHKNPSLITNRRPNIAAAAILLAADQLIANQLQLIPLAKTANTGTGKISNLTQTAKRYAPPLPPDCAALKLTYQLQRKLRP